MLRTNLSFEETAVQLDTLLLSVTSQLFVALHTQEEIVTALGGLHVLDAYVDTLGEDSVSVCNKKINPTLSLCFPLRRFQSVSVFVLLLSNFRFLFCGFSSALLEGFCNILSGPGK